jgi:triphosphoribosyl-dephospho-CoA synthase
MAGAVARDSVASEYLSDYAITYEHALPTLKLALDREGTVDRAVIQTYLELLAAVPDTLIARKHGPDMSREISSDASQVLALGGVHSRRGRRAMAAFDNSLRRADNSLNPGTTADLVATTLFVALLEGVVLPSHSIEDLVQPR